MAEYNHKAIEPKWQKRWEEESVFVAPDKPKAGKKKYVLDMFPYPSGAGLHVGHPEGYTATDIYSRYLRMNGHEVLHPMGWDAFGLPAENYAIKSGVHPKESTEQNIKTFTRQIKSLGFSYDWSREVNTSSPGYYRWTQWLFLQLYHAGLAYKKEAPVNWCPDCQTVLANEQVIDGKCERCGHKVIQKNLEQWFFRITGSDPKGKHGSYPERLLSNLETLDWPDPIKHMQANWIGRSEGAELEFEIKGSSSKIKVFTTRPDTLFGATYMVLAPEHALIRELKGQIENWDEVQQYVKAASSKSQLERTDLAKEKTGVELKGVRAVNPGNNEEIPVWIADYVLSSYGTGAIMAVPGHDERDFEFAKKFKLPVMQVVDSGEDLPSISSGKVVNSGKFDGQDSEEAKWKITDAVKGRRTIQYKLRDWLISRQRYWGAPIPIIYCETCGEQPVKEEDLPVTLPDDVDFLPKGESPLSRSKSFHNVKCPNCESPARRESDTMDTFVDSSWYFLRYTDPKNQEEFADKKKIKAWMPVDTYVGGAEHAVMHLLYSRFITMALHDLGHLGFPEPFLKLRNQGLILGPDGQKMSKSRGNVINPDEVIENFGADCMRMYEMFMGPLEDAKPWDTNGIVGVARFLERAWNVHAFVDTEYLNQEQELIVGRELARTVKKAEDDIQSFNFNTAVSAFMIFINAVYKVERISTHHWETFLKALNPFAPHITNELWEMLGHKEVIEKEKWPEVDVLLLAQDEVMYAVQVNGKLRGNAMVSTSASEGDVTKKALALANVAKHVEGREIAKAVFVKGKLINFVVK
ncbi:MAG: leucine--tRNA ligase [Candidatus Sungbacteria bacterium]|uniref:Leucine--tRNA ligase n=1 Tax=Candidatus Sungiibacteriota bacterium TaxID=2750080 RepID=A0A932YX37_9BACT|nr:leucine--tRNA ligase [Parcubacteria group bacterium]MBI4132933.1 leucine--tRNA ligase [Candidatus Sungbacteria bacterium]